MAIANLVRETISTTGQVTSNIQLSGAVAGFKSFSSAWPTGASDIPVLFTSGEDAAVATASYDHVSDQLDIVTIESILSGTAGTTDMTFGSDTQVMVIIDAAELEKLQQLNSAIGVSGTLVTIAGDVQGSGTASGVFYKALKNGGAAYDNVFFYRNTNADNDLFIGRDSVNTYIRASGTTVLQAMATGVKMLEDFEAGESHFTRDVQMDEDLLVTGQVQTGSFTVATLPSASDPGAGSRIFVTDEVGGAVEAFSDGVNFRRCTDRAIVS